MKPTVKITAGGKVHEYRLVEWDQGRALISVEHGVNSNYPTAAQARILSYENGRIIRSNALERRKSFQSG